MTFNNFLNLAEFYTGNKNWFTNSQLSLNQKEIVDLIHHSKFSVIYKNRQDGISTVLSLYLMWRMIETPGISIAMLSHPDAREVFRQNINWNLRNFKITHTIHNIDKTRLSNGSDIIYLSGKSPSALKGHSIDIVVFDDLPTDYQKRFLYDSVLVTSCSRRDGKIIIATSEPSFKTALVNSPLGVEFNEIYGGFFNGKRKVLVEKLKEHKKS